MELYLSNSSDFVRNNRPAVNYKNGVLKKFAKFTGKYLYQSLFFIKNSGSNVKDSGKSVFL